MEFSKQPVEKLYYTVTIIVSALMDEKCLSYLGASALAKFRRYEIGGCFRSRNLGYTWNFP